jgi:branched-chain amino acid aminotransferase
MTAPALLASLDGAITTVADTRIPVSDEGFLRGDGAFEVLRLYGGRPFALAAHLARLERSCAGLRLVLDRASLEREVTALLGRTGAIDALLRLVITRGGRRIAIVEPLPPVAGAPATVATVTYAPTRVLDGLKTLSYAANMLAGRLAHEQGADEALFVSPHGRVLEGTTWTFFWARDGALFTPPLEERILASITRACLLEDIDVLECVTTLEDLAAADEAFIASTVREVAPITAIDGRPLASAPGPLTAAAAEAFRRRVAAELAVSESLAARG